MFYYLLLLVMVSRLYSLFRDDALNIFRLSLIIIVQLVCLIVFEISVSLISLLIIFFIIDVTEYYAEKISSRLNIIRFISFILLCLVSLVYGSGKIDLAFNNSILAGLEAFLNIFNPFSKLNVTGNNILIILAGIFFLLNESNLLIRFIFDISGKIPILKETSEPDEKELNAGRVIGILERILIFFFVIIGQIAAVGFVIAAKGVVRYKELDDRNFAEYVLIGTLLSSFLSMFTGFIVAHLLN